MWVINVVNMDNDFIIASCDDYNEAAEILLFIKSINGSLLHQSMTLGMPIEMYYDPEFNHKGIFPEGYVNYDEENQSIYNETYFPEIVNEVRELFPGLF
jgi:hypothetical protein